MEEFTYITMPWKIFLDTLNKLTIKKIGVIERSPYLLDGIEYVKIKVNKLNNSIIEDIKKISSEITI